MALASSRNCDQPLSPAARLFHSPSFNCYVIAVIGCKTNINLQVIRDGLCQTLLKHPRFTSKLVKEGRKTRWTQTTIDLDNHIIVPKIDSKPDFPDRFVEDYISNLTKTPLDISKPLWELHLLDIKTSNAESIGIFRIHHSLGDGTSLISLLIAATRKTSDPNALPTVPSTTHKRVDHSVSKMTNCSIVVKFLLSILWGLRLIWNTIVDVLFLVLTILFFKDTQTPLKGAHGVELNTKRFVYRMVSMDHIKLVKAEMKTVT
ncbi:hypothetical protein TSUD_10270 [Trifolium subterraneum]|nr:hypothetical protein TSUD_10270 [Trifolium subterraneum]